MIFLNFNYQAYRGGESHWFVLVLNPWRGSVCARVWPLSLLTVSDVARSVRGTYWKYSFGSWRRPLFLIGSRREPMGGVRRRE